MERKKIAITETEKEMKEPKLLSIKQVMRKLINITLIPGSGVAVDISDHIKHFNVRVWRKDEIVWSEIIVYSNDKYPHGNDPHYIEVANEALEVVQGYLGGKK